MRTQVRLPKLGETTDIVVVEQWLVDVGDTVETGDALLTVETDKITTEVPSPVSGTIRELLVKPADEVSTGDRICVLDS